MASVGGGKSETLSLNLTPMLDIFSILVTFLLMSYSTDPVNHDIDPNLELPSSLTLANLDEVPTISVTRKEILVNDKSVVLIVGGDVPADAISQGAITPVYEALKVISEAHKKIFSKVGKPASDQTKYTAITMEMDQNHNYKLLKRVMLSAQQAEFVKFKLTVAKNDS